MSPQVPRPDYIKRIAVSLSKRKIQLTFDDRRCT